MRKLGVVGMPGKMAQRVVALAEGHASLRLSEAMARSNSDAVGKDSGVLAGVAQNHVPVRPFDKKAFGKADVWIEFAHHTVTKKSVNAALDAEKALLVCTTGLDADTLKALHNAAHDIPVMMAPNTSLGVAALNAALRVALKALGPSYQVEIVEIHHDKKKDAPSGTAARLVDTVRLLRKTPREKIVTGRNGMVGERRAEEIGVFAVRGGNVIGEHTVFLFGENDRLELTHRAHSRDLFASGALRAAAWLAEQPPGWYTIENCLGVETT